MSHTSADEPEPDGAALPAKVRRRRPSAAQTVGGVLFGFEQQVWRTAPPPQEFVHHARPDSPVPAGDGTMLTFVLPDDATLASDVWCGPDGVCLPSVDATAERNADDRRAAHRDATAAGAAASGAADAADVATAGAAASGAADAADVATAGAAASGAADAPNVATAGPAAVPGPEHANGADDAEAAR